MKKYLFLVLCFTVSHFFVEAQNSAQADSCWKSVHDDIDSFLDSNYHDEFILYKDSMYIQMSLTLDNVGMVINVGIDKYKGKLSREDVFINLMDFLISRNYVCLNTILYGIPKYRDRKYDFEYNLLMKTKNKK